MRSAIRRPWAASLVLGAAMAGLLVSPTFAAIHYQPDGRIRLGTGAWVGSNVYNTTGVHQTSSTLMLVPTTVAYERFSFGISIRNAGTATDRFTIKASGALASYYTVAYFHGTTNITAAVVAGAYRSAPLAPGSTFLITARVTGNTQAVAGTSVTRLVTLRSNADSTRTDAVKLVVRTLAM